MEPEASRLTNAGDAHAACGDYAEAIEIYEEALRLGGATPRLHHNLGRALYEMGEVSQATRHFKTAAAGCDAIDPWLALATLVPGDPGASNENILETRRAFAARLESIAPARAPGRAPGPPGRRIRVGYLSSWFDHANYMKPVWSLLKHLDRASFEVHLFSDTLPENMPGFVYAGLRELVARDAASLEDLRTLAGARGRLERWRAVQRDRLSASPVCDGAALGRHMAHVYRAVVRQERTPRSAPRS